MTKKWWVIEKDDTALMSFNEFDEVIGFIRTVKEPGRYKVIGYCLSQTIIACTEVKNENE